jgi:multicomponent Na+:H+ antiporter subunit D
MCVVQRHIKRLLAFSTISHVGVFLCGIGLLSAQGLAGVAVYVVGHGLTKAALFMLAGILLHRFRSVDELDLHGRGRALPLVGVLFAVGGLLLAAIPIFTTFFGKSLLDGAAIDGHYPWLPAILVISSAATGGAVLRVTGRVFLGWGPKEGPEDALQGPAREEQDEESAARDRTPPLMVVTPAVLLLGAIVIALIPGAVPGFETAADHFRDHGAYIGWVLRGVAHFPAVAESHLKGYDYVYGLVATAGVVGVAALGLFGRPLRGGLPDQLLGPVVGAVDGLRRLHSGHIGDYIAWWTTGAAVLGGLSLLLLT